MNERMDIDSNDTMPFHRRVIHKEKLSVMQIHLWNGRVFIGVK